MSKVRVLVVLGLAGLLCPSAGAAVIREAHASFAICPNVTTTTEFQTPQQMIPGCGPDVHSPNSIDVENGCTPRPANTDLGAFLTTQNPFGAMVLAGSAPNCATNPPTLGPGAGRARITLSVTQRGFCPTTFTVEAREGPLGGVAFPLGKPLPLGTYDVTLTLPDQTLSEPIGAVNWLGVQVSGTLRVGTTFTETDKLAAPSGNNFAALLRNSFAGRGAGEIALTRSGALHGTEYYECGSIEVAGSVTFLKRGHIRGRGALNGGSGNYKGIKGTFTLAGTYNAKTKRGTFALKGEASY